MGDELLKLRLSSDPAEIAPVRMAVEQRGAAAGFDEKSCGEMGLCVNEALANVIRHAYDNRPGQPIEVSIEIKSNSPAAPSAIIQLRDWGNGINPTKIPMPEKVKNPLLPGGLGMICLRELMDSVVFEPQPDGMLLTLCRNRDRTNAAAGCACDSGQTRNNSRQNGENGMDDLNPGTPLIPSAQKDGENVRATISGDIDLHNSPELREGLIELLLQAQPKQLILDLSQVTYMDSSAIAVLVEMLQKLRKVKGGIQLTNLHPRVKSLLQIARLDTIFQLT